MIWLTDFKALYEKACKYALKHHAGQKYGDHPYIVHLENVASVLVRFGFHPEIGTEAEKKVSRDLIIAALLHDVIEDTSLTQEDVSESFGDDIALLVYAVSNEPGRNRRERHEKSHHKVIDTDNAILIKLADRIANLEKCNATGSGLINMYRKEWKGFKDKLKDSTDAPDIMWAYLEKLIT